MAHKLTQYSHFLVLHTY